MSYLIFWWHLTPSATLSPWLPCWQLPGLPLTSVAAAPQPLGRLHFLLLSFKGAVSLQGPAPSLQHTQLCRGSIHPSCSAHLLASPCPISSPDVASDVQSCHFSLPLMHPELAAHLLLPYFPSIPASGTILFLGTLSPRTGPMDEPLTPPIPISPCSPSVSFTPPPLLASALPRLLSSP